MNPSSENGEGMKWPDGGSMEEEHVKAAKRIGIATLEKKDKNVQDDLNNKKGKQEVIIKPGFALLFFGVILPVAAMLFEHSSHTMAKAFFDPFPTFNHYLLFSLIPISNFLTWLSARSNIQAVYSITALTSGMSLGIAILYSLMLLPITPLLVFAFPIGLLGLAPLASIPYIMQAGKTICQLAGRHDTFFDAHQFKHLGHVIVLVMVISVELPSTLTRIHLSDATKPDPSISADAINWLRDWGSRDVLLRACYERSGRATDLIGSLYEHQHPVSIESARNIYYRVTGIPFNSVPIPTSFRSTIQHNGIINDPDRLNAGAVDEFDLDPDIAGEMVQGVARGLTVDSSTIDGIIDADARVASLKWTFNFNNISLVPREARAKILLPEGAVVERATMWIDGQEKEAKIMGRSKARATYERAVRTHSRDPLLVSMQGKDTVLVQCYPVLKESDTKIRLQIAAPMTSSDRNHAELSLPTFAERNFAFTRGHNLNLAGKTKFTITNTDFASAPSKEGTQSIAASLENSLLSRHEARVLAEVNPAIHFARINSIPVKVEIPTRTYETPEQLTVLVDTSIGMKPYIKEVSEGLEALVDKNKNVNFEVIALTDSNIKRSKTGIEEQLKELKLTECKGGVINSPYVAGHLTGLSGAGKDIFWIHAAQPVAENYNKKFVESKFKYMDRKLYDLQVASGPNALFDKASMEENFIRVSPGADLKSSIENLNRFWSDSDKDKSQKAIFAIDATAENTIDNPLPAFESLRVYKKVLDSYYQGDVYGASTLAVSRHLITPVTSAVVSDDQLVEKYESRAQRIRNQERYKNNRQIDLRPLSRLNSSFAVFEKTNLSQAASSPPPSADYGATAGEGGLVGAPVDPRYGQSNEVGLLARRAAKSYPASAPRESVESRARNLEAKMAFKKSAEPLDELGSIKEEGYKSDKDSAMLSNNPNLQGATNGNIGPAGQMIAEEESMVFDDQMEGDGAPMMKEKKSNIFQALKAEVVPEPDTTPMLLIAVLMLGAGLFTILRSKKEKPADNR